MNGVCWPLATSVIWDDPSPGLERPPGGNGCTRIGARDLFFLVVFFCLLQPWRLSPGEERGSHPQLRGQRPGNKWTAGSPWPWVSSSCASPLAVWSLSSILLVEWPGASGAKRAVEQPVASLLFWPRMKKKEKSQALYLEAADGEGTATGGCWRLSVSTSSARPHFGGTPRPDQGLASARRATWRWPLLTVGLQP